MENLFLFIGFGMQEMVILLVIILILFGGSRLPGLAKGLGESIRNFKQGMAEAESEDDKKDKAKSA
ncbi:MAG: twin-arginine translocase TatA/TatE family subunit [Blastocatellales bacterium]